MTEQYKKGDRVKVTKEFEGIVEYASDRGNGYHLVDSSGNTIAGGVKVGRLGVVSIEKLEPPVEVFKPGDVVRHLLSRNVYAITERGFVRLSGAGFLGGRNGVEIPYRADYFTSGYYEKVNLG